MSKIKKLLEKLDETLFNLKENAIYLYEMSQPQGKVRDNIRNLSTIITEHIVKVIMYGKEEQKTIHHWAHEINNWLLQCMKSKIKRNRKDSYPTEEELYNWLTDYYKEIDDLTGIRNTWENEYTYQGHKSRKELKDIDIYNSYVKIIKELSKLTSQNKNTDEKVQQVLESNCL